MLSSELKHLRVFLTLRVNPGDTHQGLGHILPTRSENPVGTCLPQVYRYNSLMILWPSVR